MKKLLLFSSLLLCAFLNAQNVKITGTVKDSLGNGLEMVNIMATKKMDGSMEGYAISNYEGKFSILVPEGNTYLLTASYLGMKATVVEVDLMEKIAVEPLQIVLREDKQLLDGVELVYEMPVVVRGDTIIYNTDSFTNGSERKLGDVLKKLPGIQVDDDGGIKVEGKTVSKVMVDGKDFFDGDSKLATKNIPADALSKVEVLKNYNEVDQMRGLGNDEENVALNIKLKEGKEDFWFGEVEGGLGYGEKTRYLGSTKLFYYSPDTSVNLIGKSNNTGEVPFTFSDYFRFSGGFKNFNQGGGTSFNINDSGLGFLITQNDRAHELQSHFGAANATHQLSKKWSFSAFSIYSDNQTRFIQQSVKNYIQTGATEFTSNNSAQQNRLGLLKLSSVYKPNHRFQLDYDVFLKNINQGENGETISEFFDENGSVQNQIEEQKQNSAISINQNINAYYTLNANNIFAGYFQHLYQDEDPFYNAILRLQPFVSVLPLNEDQDSFNINQNRRISTNKFDAKIDFYHIINDLSNINLNLGSIYSRQQFNSSIFEIAEDGEVNYFEDKDLENDVNYRFRDVFFGTKYKVKTGIFTFTPGLTLHNFNIYLEDQKGQRENNMTMLLPNFHTNLQLRNSESLTFTYNMIADFTDINNVAEGYIFSNYNRLFRGNREIENGIFHNLNLNYSNFSMFNFTSIYGNLSYSKRINAIRNNTFIENINTISSVINSDFVDETLSANGSFQKKFRKYSANLKSNISLSTLNLVVNGQNRESENFTQNYEGSLETNFKSSPNFEIGYNFSNNTYKNGDLESTFLTHRPFANIEYDFLNAFTVTADYSYFNYRDREGSIANEYSFLNAKLYYQKPESVYEFSLNASNLLNVQSINRDSFNENYNITSQFFVQPRIIMFSVKYNL
ncbi:carboxypeptidase regulatory-like domain-containing protein [Gramella sp. AN32]|uniref:Carboxypeptidase regulatory-like domain-containing protein n=1 Tax=Christiangramia antarctica TaxID=2058158 RepID=A0ABW5X247_9FLAO|nr:carboxypeptidase regulatory-like domain-containing protein [Gramella sp. AN32]MCM4157771.1 TonB-dependent receptor [Gramella sp. AN32]